MTDDLVARLRGTYRVPVNDGAGLLNGLDYFERQFPTSKLAMEAADELERLREAARGQLVVVNSTEARVRELEAELAEAYERAAKVVHGAVPMIPMGQVDASEFLDVIEDAIAAAIRKLAQEERHAKAE